MKKNPDGTVGAVEIYGHAGYAKKGHDIICSAVSAIAYTAAGALEELAGLKRCYSERDGQMSIRLPREMTEQQKKTSRVILDAAVIGFRQVELSYGEYVMVVEEEVQTDD
ncbi:MAG: ribosomal-processing cysteine protease Prp [Acetivibrionales bacterium]